MKLSIVIPNFNGAAVLAKAVRSCLRVNLDFLNYEIVVVDNCSTDDSLLILEDLKKDIPNLRIVENEFNIGRIGNWNRCLEVAKGEYSLFLMVNDEISENCDFNKILKSCCSDYATFMSYFIVDKDTIYSYCDHNIEKFYDLYSCEYVVDRMFEYAMDLYDLGPLQTLLLDNKIVSSINLSFDENYNFLSDIKFICDYLSCFEQVKFYPTPIFSWFSSGHRFAFSSRDLFYFEFVDLFNEKYKNKKLSTDVYHYMLSRLFFELLFYLIKFDIPSIVNKSKSIKKFFLHDYGFRVSLFGLVRLPYWFYRFFRRLYLRTLHSNSYIKVVDLKIHT